MLTRLTKYICLAVFVVTFFLNGASVPAYSAEYNPDLPKPILIFLSNSKKPEPGNYQIEVNIVVDPRDQISTELIKDVIPDITSVIYDRIQQNYTNKLRQRDLMDTKFQQISNSI